MAPEGPLQVGGQQVGLHQAEARLARQGAQVGRLLARRVAAEGVDAEHAPALGDQRLGHPGADEAGAAGHDARRRRLSGTLASECRPGRAGAAAPAGCGPWARPALAPPGEGRHDQEGRDPAPCRIQVVVLTCR